MAERFLRYGWHLDLEINLVKQRPGNPAPIARNLVGRATTAPIGVAEITAWAGVHRRHQLKLRGELCLERHLQSPGEAEKHFQRALEIARGQEATSLELRAAMSLARLWRQQGDAGRALPLLGSVYSRFREGFESGDLREAKALLTELGG